MKSVFKFRVGSGQILAFLILAVVLSSVAGVVFIAINQSQDKNTEAGALIVQRPPTTDYNTCDFNKDGKIGQPDIDLVGANFEPNRYKITREQLAYDINRDGVVNSLDLQVIAQRNTKYCYLPSTISYSTCDFNKDGAIGQADIDLVGANFEPDRNKITSAQLVYDINRDGVVNSLDLQIVASKNSKYCTESMALSTQQSVEGTAFNICDLNRDKVVNSGDQAIMASAVGKVTENSKFYDLNHDGYINSGDQGMLAQGISKYPTPTKFCY